MTTSLTYARATLEATPPRALKLIRGISWSPAIRAQLAQVGLTRADLEEGLALIFDSCRLGLDVPEPVDVDAVRAAIVELDAWDERGFLLVRATLSHRFAEQARFVLAGLSPCDGPEAVQGVAVLLDRLDALAHDPRREESCLDDQAALDALAARGLGPDERARLRGLVNLVARATTGRAEGTRTAEGEQLAVLTRLRRWFDEWADLCRAVLTRPSQLARLGLVPSPEEDAT